MNALVPASDAPTLSRRTVIAGAAWAVPVIVTVSATPALAVSAGPTVTATTPNMQSPAAGNVLVTATVTDASGAPMTGQPVSFTGPDGVSFSPTTASTDGSGVATSTMTTSDAWALPGSSITVTALSGGASGSAVVTQLGANAYAVGGNDHGKAGVPGSASPTSPTQLALVFPSPIVSVVTGSAFSLALLKDGTVWSVGSNAVGQLGDGTTTDRATWARIDGLSDVTQIAASDSLSMAVLADGTIRAWGDNSDGQLGNGSTAPNSPTPVTVAGIGSSEPKAVQIALGFASSYALLEDGSIRSWGNNDEGQLGNATTTPRNTPGALVWGPRGQLTRVTQISAGAYSAYARMTDGTISAWGNNNRGRLGDGTTTNSSLPTTVSGITTATQVVAGYVSAYAVLTDGTVKSWGGNEQGQLGNGTQDYATAYSTPQSVQTLTNVTQITAAVFGAYAITSDGTVYAWGNNAATATTATPTVVSGAANTTYLQDNSSEASNNTLFLIVGDRTITVSANPSQVAADGTLVVSATMMDNRTGVGLGQQTVSFSSTAGSVSPAVGTTEASGTAGTQLSPDDTWMTPGTVISVRATSAGMSAALPVTVLGANACAIGANDLGYKDTSGGAGTDSTDERLLSPTQLSRAFPSPLVKIGAGVGYTIALLKDGTVWGVGNNDSGQLGDGTTTSRSSWARVPDLTEVVDIAVASNTVLAVTTGGSVLQWGQSLSQRRGSANTTTPQAVSEITTAIGVALAPDSGEGSAAYALLSDGHVVSWGAGALGDGTTAYRTEPGPVTGINTAIQIAASTGTAFALLSDGTIKSWGMNSAGGNLGNGTEDDPYSESFVDSPVTVSDITTATRVVAAGYSTYALLSNGQIRAWGGNNYGQLGDGTTTTRNTPVAVKNISTATQIGTTDNSAYALLADGTALAWGGNDQGQLGDGTTTGRTEPAAFPSTALTGAPAIIGFSVNTTWRTGFAILG
ncbi:alpha-tubulin suppressor [Microbacterium testaceum StLB037]|uniref:Alpha-tubulin suppressor n=1 Tax=Microbacterium testaceum (strain StLB037) TaxID=979556 RepID=E8NBJ0_MICTS|nr:Ig-like domain-containing protein [Microbacterium testaceum]BAJ76047.1 alpha-tubulin suppressor [Microbacterium testaceum StLB037]